MRKRMKIRKTMKILKSPWGSSSLSNSDVTKLEAKLGTIEDNQRLLFDKVVKSFGSIASILTQNNGTPDETVNEQGFGSGQSIEITEEELDAEISWRFCA
ncbi:hypothetical protein L2E82_28163 [Cichorium intybus]|uniref:Uncharacterized protein n=1 Tax=Cichorium intybus TaxID=13427 RepID=A0ACB9CV10_CICIN|nr:hypothetical protein L2E82_28163 [Cichorium intybus]